MRHTTRFTTMACLLLAAVGTTQSALGSGPPENKALEARTVRIAPTRRLVTPKLQRNRQTARRGVSQRRASPARVGRSQPSMPTGDQADSPDVTYWVWIPGDRAAQPTMREGYWQLSGVFPLIQAQVSHPDSGSRNPPGVSGFGKQAKYDKTESWDGKRPAAAAAQMVAWVRYYKLRMGRIGRSDFKYALHLNGFGAPNKWGRRPNPMTNRRNVWALGQNPKDALAAPISAESRVGAWFGARGRTLNAEWSRRFVNAFETRRKQDHLPAPTALHCDVEGIYNINTISEWWEPALNDPRASTELIDGEHTLVELASMAPPFDSSVPMHRKKNRAFGMWANGINICAGEYAMEEGFWKQARAVWPNVELSNYGFVPGSPEVPFPLQKIGMELTNVRLRHATHAAPVLYPLKPWAYQNGKVSVADHMRRYDPGATLTGDKFRDMSAMNLAAAKARIDAALANGVTLVPWVRNPDKRFNQEDLAELIRYGNEHGVREWILFSKKGYDWTGLLELVQGSSLASH